MRCPVVSGTDTVLLEEPTASLFRIHELPYFPENEGSISLRKFGILPKQIMSHSTFAFITATTPKLWLACRGGTKFIESQLYETDGYKAAAHGYTSTEVC
jgi:hypothetical protein